MNKWVVGIDPYDDGEQGYIVHRQAPEFVAKWMIEDDNTVISELVYTDADDEAAVTVYDFEWTDAAPSEDLFRSTMADAVTAIDEYLATMMQIREEND